MQHHARDYSDINVKSPFAQKSRDEKVETWQPIFPDLNFILLKGNAGFVDRLIASITPILGFRRSVESRTWSSWSSTLSLQQSDLESLSSTTECGSVACLEDSLSSIISTGPLTSLVRNGNFQSEHRARPSLDKYHAMFPFVCNNIFTKVLILRAF